MLAQQVQSLHNAVNQLLARRADLLGAGLQEYRAVDREVCVKRVFRAKSGYTGLVIGEYEQAGSNGLALDHEGRLTIYEHGTTAASARVVPGTDTV